MMPRLMNEKRKSPMFMIKNSTGWGFEGWDSFWKKPFSQDQD